MSTLAIKIFTWADQGAPILTGQLGKLVDLLDAVLVNGYGSVSVSSITRVGAVATVTCATAHGLATGDSSMIAGATEVDYNGDFVVTVTSTTVFTFAVPNSPATPATGTITAKRASADFAKAFAGTNQAAYRSNNVAYNRHYLQVKDDGAGLGGNSEALLRAYESMTGVLVGTNPSPTVAWSTFGFAMKKSNTSDATARPWVIITDGVLFYLWVNTNQTTTVGFSVSNGYCFTGWFGDFVSYKVGDVFNSMVGANCSENGTSSTTGGLGYQTTTLAVGALTQTTAPLCVARDFTGTGTSKPSTFLGTGIQVAMSGNSSIPYPNPVDGALMVVPISIMQGTPNAFRGRLPGLYESLQGVSTHIGFDKVDNVSGLAGRKLMWLPCLQSSTNSGHWIDITGPWR